MALAAMYSFLLDRHQASDVDGAFTVNILKVRLPSLFRHPVRHDD
jgi:hypothetical protein